MPPPPSAIVDPTETTDAAIDSSEFEIDLQLQSKELLGFLVVMTLFYSVFTLTFYVGIPVKTVFESIGTSSKSEALMDKYNAYSSYIMALVEVLLGMYMDQFVPALNVYFHNALFFLVRDSKGQLRSVRSRRFHSALLLLLPVVVALTNSSVKGLQAVQFITGVKRIVTVDDVRKEQPVLEKIKAKPTVRSRLTRAANQRPVSDTILKNAVRQQTTPFTFDTNSPCRQNTADTANGTTASLWKLSAHDMGGTSAIYGFIPREWNSEALTTEPNRTSTYTVTYREATKALNTNVSLPIPANFSIKTAYEMLVQGKMVIERAFGDAVVGSYDCWLSDVRDKKLSTLKSSSSDATETSDEVEVFVDDSADQWTIGSDGTRLCEGGISSMFKMGDYYSRDEFAPEDLVRDAANIIGITIPFLAKEETQITLDTYELTPQIRLETMQIDLLLNTSAIYGPQTECQSDDVGCDSKYVYLPFQNTFCGSNNCAFFDISGAFPIQPEIGVLPYYVNCTLDKKHIHYSADFRAYFPDECKRAAKTTFLYGYGSYMTGKEFGSNDSDWSSSYIMAPRRRISFAFAKVVWTTENLAKKYNASCGVDFGQNVSCEGLSYQLQPSGRFLFAGKQALPNNALRGTSFRSPIPLVQLNSPTVEFDGERARIERLAPENFNKTVWPRQLIYNNSALGGNHCSMLMDSYLNHVNENHFFLERPLQAMYTSFFYFLMENAAVAELNDTSLALRGISTQTTPTKDHLGNVRLKGDLQLRSIRISIPFDSYLATLFGCVCVFIGTVVIVFVPIRCVRYFPQSTTKAERFMTMRNEKDYPSNVHNKLLELPASRTCVCFDDLTIDTLRLKHCSPLATNAANKIQSAVETTATEKSESESDVSQSTISEEIA